MYQQYNPNPTGKHVGDCTVRAISKALGQDWDTTYWGLAEEGALIKDMPSANAVWGSYLREHGFRRSMAPDGITVAEFADLYTIRDQMDKAEQQEDPRPVSLTAYSHAPEPPLRGSDFLDLAAGKDPALVWEILDDLMDTLSVANPRAYRGVMRRLEAL